MLNVVIDFSKIDIEIKFADSIPARSIKKARITKEENNGHMILVQNVIADLKRTYGNEDIHISVNLPALYEDLIETKNGSINEIVDALENKEINVYDKILLYHAGFNSGKGSIVVPVALVSIKHQSIMNEISADQYTTNILRLSDVAERDNIKGHVTIVYNSEEENSEILFFNENNVPVAYTKTILGEGITGLADVVNNKNRVPIDKRRVKSLSHNIVRQFGITTLPSKVQTVGGLQFLEEDGQMSLIPTVSQSVVSDESYKELPQAEDLTHGVEHNKSQHQFENDNENYLQQPYKHKRSKEDKKAKTKVKSKKKVQEVSAEQTDNVGKKLIPPRLVAVLITLAFVVVIATFLSSRMLIDMKISKSENNTITFDQTQETIPLMTYVSSALTASGIRTNTVESIIDEDGSEHLLLGIHNIDDNSLISLQTRLESRCVIELTDLEPSKDTEQGNRAISLKISYK